MAVNGVVGVALGMQPLDKGVGLFSRRRPSIIARVLLRKSTVITSSAAGSDREGYATDGSLTLREFSKYRSSVKAKEVIEALGALAHEHRLAVFRLLVERGPEGLPAGQIGARLGLVPSSLTFHLQALQRAGLISQQRVSRQLIYSADFETMNAVVGYLTENCCAAGTQCAPACKPARRAPAKRAATA